MMPSSRTRLEKTTLITPSIYLIVFLIFFAACSSDRNGYGDIPTDSVTVAKGKVAFSQNCSACHNFRQDGIGPQLGGITETVSSTWLRDFIRNPKAVVESGD